LEVQRTGIFFHAMALMFFSILMHGILFINPLTPINISVRCTFESNSMTLHYQYCGALHLWIIRFGRME
jgi:hypothetical protein